ncbi:hypothetical protein HGM15179_004341 [Zosterops borbonicus]|uniref:Uncharacterized protein n=1 Tax=Zosterops borbonicus TaxID=364589 RepID=A0A8K1LR52_9PASS|nr:hypothetical protein HGM15179_004341 [Zosterops borbonicus]
MQNLTSENGVLYYPQSFALKEKTNLTTQLNDHVNVQLHPLLQELQKSSEGSTKGNNDQPIEDLHLEGSEKKALAQSRYGNVAFLHISRRNSNHNGIAFLNNEIIVQLVE